MARGDATSPLNDYFSSAGFWDGEIFAAEEHGYELTNLAAVQVFKHKGTGIKVWSLALDLRHRQADEPGTNDRLLYYYTNETLASKDMILP
eukprot:Skav227891  [mRNA]  locus=scaffold1951:51913:52688:+ [translate_table: standard]